MGTTWEQTQESASGREGGERVLEQPVASPAILLWHPMEIHISWCNRLVASWCPLTLLTVEDAQSLW